MKAVKNGLVVIAALFLCSSVALAQDHGRHPDPFEGKLFPPDLIMKNQVELDLSREQFTSIKAAVVEVQANVAEHEWDLREAYQKVLAALDEDPVDEQEVLGYVNDVLLAENQVKQQQVRMLIRIRNLLNNEQVAYLASLKND